MGYHSNPIHQPPPQILGYLRVRLRHLTFDINRIDARSIDKHSRAFEVWHEALRYVLLAAGKLIEGDYQTARHYLNMSIINLDEAERGDVPEVFIPNLNPEGESNE